MKNLSILLIITALITSCAKHSNLGSQKELLYGDWYGGPGIKYTVTNKKQEWLQDIPAGNALFVYGADGIFINHSANTKSLYELKENKIYGDIDKPDKKRYYIIKKLTAQTLTVVGPYKDDGELFVPGIVYELNYYRKN